MPPKPEPNEEPPIDPPAWTPDVREPDPDLLPDELPVPNPGDNRDPPKRAWTGGSVTLARASGAVSFGTANRERRRHHNRIYALASEDLKAYELPQDAFGSGGWRLRWEGEQRPASDASSIIAICRLMASM